MTETQRAAMQAALDTLMKATPVNAKDPQMQADAIVALRAALAEPVGEPVAQLGVGNSGFDHKTAADFLSGKNVSDENVRRFVAQSRWAHDGSASLRALTANLRQDLALRDAEIALLKQSLLNAEAPQPQQPAEPAGEPVYWGQPDACGNIVDGISTTDKDVGHKGWTDEYSVPLYKAPQPQQPAEVPLLSDDEIRALFMAHAKKNEHGVPYLTTYIEGGTHLIRTVEQAVRQKAGLK